MESARTRFAPSPTGFLHVGGIRTALYNYLLAQQTGGQFILRLEDTDRERFVEAGVGQIAESLDWVGLTPDEGFWISQDQQKNVDYIQSERHKSGIYQRHVGQLVTKGLAYYSVASDEELNAMREQAKREKRAFMYRFGDHPEDSTEKPASKDYVIRFHAQKFFEESGIPALYKKHFSRPGPQGYAVTWKTADSTSASEWNSAVMEDFILIKADGFPTYNFANVVDDRDMKITHVLRGSEFISSTAKHIALYAALEVPEDEIPTFVHLPVINGEDGKKLSKRTDDTNALHYRDKGYPPEALLNFLALLGWNDGSQQEIYELDELVEKFSLKGINSSPAVFDEKRLNWLSGQWIREKIDPGDLYKRSKDFWPESAASYDDDYKQQVLGVVRERLKFFAELPELTEFFFTDLPVNPELITSHKQLKKLSPGEIKDLLEKARASLEQSDFNGEDLTERLNNLLEQTGQKPAVLFSLIRIATTQAPASPGLADTLAILGKDRSLKRIDSQLAALK